MRRRNGSATVAAAAMIATLAVIVPPIIAVDPTYTDLGCFDTKAIAETPAGTVALKVAASCSGPYHCDVPLKVQDCVNACYQTAAFNDGDVGITGEVSFTGDLNFICICLSASLNQFQSGGRCGEATCSDGHQCGKQNHYVGDVQMSVYHVVPPVPLPPPVITTTGQVDSTSTDVAPVSTSPAQVTAPQGQPSPVVPDPSVSAGDGTPQSAVPPIFSTETINVMTMSNVAVTLATPTVVVHTIPGVSRPVSPTNNPVAGNGPNANAAGSDPHSSSGTGGDSSKLPASALAGIIAASILVLLAAILFILLRIRNWRRGRNKPTPSQPVALHVNGTSAPTDETHDSKFPIAVASRNDVSANLTKTAGGRTTDPLVAPFASVDPPSDATETSLDAARDRNASVGAASSKNGVAPFAVTIDDDPRWSFVPSIVGPPASGSGPSSTLGV